MQWQQQGDLEKAKSLYREILDEQAGNPDALHLYGLACHQQGDHQTAVLYIEQAVKRVPGQPVLRNNLGDALRRAGNLEGAALQLQRALELDPEYAGAHLNLGSVYFDAGNHDAALHHAREAVRLAPERSETWFNLGLILLDHIRLEEAVEAFRKSLEIRPGYEAAATGLLYTLNLLPGIDPEAVVDEHREVAKALFPTPSAWAGQAAVASPVRIGYVSGDFCAHAVNHFFEPILQHHDAAQFEVFCYSDTEHPDGVTRRLQACATQWREISGLPDEEVTRQIRSDRIDILVDLAGYTKRNRLGVFARRAARCQLSYLGYPATTGLETMDYRIVDPTTAPPGEGQHGTETLLRLSGGFACFRPPKHAPGVALSPYSSRGHITFGSLHKLEKINPAVVDTWAGVLHRTPGSRLLVARDELDAWQQERLTALFQDHGIDAERLQLRHFGSGSGSFLELFAEIDIQLDTFPWSGHTMACMALWMGVPVVTLHGNSHAGRMVASVLGSLGLGELVSDGRESYVRISTELAADKERLEGYRTGLRSLVERSPLCNEAGFTRVFEKEMLRLAEI